MYYYSVIKTHNARQSSTTVLLQAKFEKIILDESRSKALIAAGWKKNPSIIWLFIPSLGPGMILENSENNLWCFVRSSYSCLGSRPTFPFILPLFHCQLSSNLPHLFHPSLSDTHTSTAKWVLLRGSGACKATLARAHLCQTNQHTWFTYHRAQGLINGPRDKTAEN